MLDIIFFAAIAIFIFFKLREQLGKVDDNQKRDAIKKFITEKTKIANQNQSQNQPTLVAIPGVGVVANPQNPVDLKSQKILNKLQEPLRSSFKATLQKTDLSPAQFLDGATLAFEMVLEAFAANNLAILKPLLSDKIFTQFEETIKKRQAEGQTLNTKIIAIDQSKIVDAKIVDNFAIISIEFISQQINYINDSAGEITFGSKTEINNINDIWTFKKDCNSNNPNWVVVATS